MLMSPNITTKQPFHFLSFSLSQFLLRPVRFGERYFQVSWQINCQSPECPFPGDSKYRRIALKFSNVLCACVGCVKYMACSSARYMRCTHCARCMRDVRDNTTCWWKGRKVLHLDENVNGLYFKISQKWTWHTTWRVVNFSFSGRKIS